MAPPPPSPWPPFKIVEQSQVSPPPGSVPTTSLPLSFFDLLWHLCCPIQRLYFYQLPHHDSTQLFNQTILPNLKNSLSLTLQHFFPFAGNIFCPPSPARPYIHYAAGDSVPFSVAESYAEFDLVIADYPRDVQELHPFVPKLPPARAEGDTRVFPLMALQVTVFPNSGISVGVTFCHMAADGRAFHHFMKSWASVCKSNGDLRFIEKSPPCHDRELIKVPTELELEHLKDLWDWAKTWKEPDEGPILNQLAGKVRATFLMGQAQIERLKHWVTDECIHHGFEVSHISTFVVTSALLWVCLIKSEELIEIRSKVLDDEDANCYFGFLADCRNRLEFPIPNTYFGNCLASCIVSIKRKELLGVNGIVLAVKAIGKKIGELESYRALDGAEKWIQEYRQVLEKCFVTVAGSPKFGIYDTDFGWGRPKKIELVHTDVSGSISLSENREDKNGVEFRLALSRAKMDHFNAILEESLRMIFGSQS